MNAVELEGITKVFLPGLAGAPIPALQGINLAIAEGEVVGLLGPNGSGKTTLLKIILGLLAPTAGVCRVFGQPSHRAAARSATGYLPESPEFYPFLTGTELVRFFAALAGMAGAGREHHIRDAIALVGMAGAAGRRVGTYSRGMKQRIGLAQALVANPRLVILDEPTANLDPEGAMEIGEIIRRIRARGGTVLLSSHQLEQIEDLCTRVAFLNRGRLVASGTVKELTQPYRENTLVVMALPEADQSALRAWLADRGARLQAGPMARRNGLEQAYLAAVRNSRPDEARFP
ncbi:MAG TPA: ABC transporter ATP-binding protein [Opitutaceae bacterium]|nr:ABC transporter ATP-binding protein [Opitutaceae bacterium]